MAVAPIENPIQAAPLTSGTQADLDARADAQKEHLTPGNVGEQLHTQMQQHAQTVTQQATTAAQQATEAQLQQSNQTIESLQSQLNTLTAAMTQSAPAQTQPNLDEQHAYTQEELTELGQRLPGTIDKRAELAAARMRDEAVAAANQAAESQISTLQQEIDSLKQQYGGLQTENANAFRAQAMAMASANGLSITQLAQDTEWQGMLSETADPITGVTYHDHLQNAITNKDPAAMGTLFEIYNKRQQAKQQTQHQAAPQPQGGAARMSGDGGGEGLDSVQAEIDGIYKQQTDLRQQRLSQQISVEQFQTQMNALTAQMKEVQSKLEQFYQ